MNRGTVVLLALAILLAHTLAIHLTPAGDMAMPYELAHVAYRLGRNLVYEGSALWNPGGPIVESYPSPAWILVAATAARAYFSPILLTQVIGLCSVLATVVVLAQFSPKRTAGLIAPILLAASGSAAASAFSGTEASLAMLLVTTTFLAFERGWPRLLALALALLLFTRPEAGLVLLLLLACERWWRPRGEHARRPALWSAYRLPLIVIVATTIGRRVLTGQWVSPFSAPLTEIDPERWKIGWLYLSSFAVSSGFGLVFLVVILSLCAGRSSASGGRALALAGLWWAVVVVSGGDGLPFWLALVPVLPLFFLGVQECMRVWMDERESLARVAWPILVATVGASLLVSKVPGDLGPLRLERLLTSWQTPRGELAEAYPRPLGRLGLMEEIRTVEHLRTVGIFLRNRVSADAAILTSWPGAIGYLSRKEVLDLTGRASPLPHQERPLSWRGVSRVDVVASLTSDVDYIVPVIGTLSETDAPQDFLYTWLEQLDTLGATPRRRRALLEALRDFVLVYVPVAAESGRSGEPAESSFPLLQRRDVERTPVLELEIADRKVRVLARNEGHQQVVDLCLRASDGNGGELFLRPTGSWTTAGPLDARTGLLVFPTGARSIQLIEARVPDELLGAQLAVWLHNPGMPPDAPLSQVGTPVHGQL